MNPTESTDGDEHYIVAVNDLYRVPKDEVDSEAEAERHISERLGEDPYLAHDTEVIDEITAPQPNAANGETNE